MLLYRIFLRQVQLLLHSPAGHQEVSMNTVRTSANALVSCRGARRLPRRMLSARHCKNHSMVFLTVGFAVRSLLGRSSVE